jgi:hypothetical protein
MAFEVFTRGDLVAAAWNQLGLPAIAAAAATTATTAATTAAIIATATATPVAATTAAAAAAVVATATTAIAATTAAAIPATAAAAALLALLGLVDAQRPTVEGLAVHALDGLGRFLGRTHRHEREPTRPPGLPIGHEVDVTDGSELLERGTNAIGGRVEREVSYIQTSVHRLLELAR